VINSLTEELKENIKIKLEKDLDLGLIYNAVDQDKG
jgi:hypothetical protein